MQIKKRRERNREYNKLLKYGSPFRSESVDNIQDIDVSHGLQLVWIRSPNV